MRRKPESRTGNRAATRDVLNVLGKTAERFGAFRPALEVLLPPAPVPTLLIQYDHATRIGGHPSNRIVTAHGPSGHGKTAMALALILSYLVEGHLVFHVDAERTTDTEWVKNMFGVHADLMKSGRYFALRPDSYEQAVDKVREFGLNVKAAVDAGEVPPGTKWLLVVDSMNRLTPKDFTKNLLKDGGAVKSGFDGSSGRGGQRKAAANAAWFDELVALVDNTNGSAMLITREAEDPNADANDKKYGRDFRITGGRALIYDASLLVRVERAGYVLEKPPKEGEKGNVIGERHRVTLSKSKIAAKDGYDTRCYFHTSNGKIFPVGLDRARDLLELATNFGVVTNNGAFFYFGKKRLGQGLLNAVKTITKDTEMSAEIEALVRAKFAKVAPQKAEPDAAPVSEKEEE